MNLRRLKDALVYASAESIQARDAFIAAQKTFATIATEAHPQGPYYRKYQAALDNLMTAVAQYDRSRAASNALLEAVLHAEETEKPRNLYAVVSSTGEVLGGAPFDAESMEAAEAEVRATLKLSPGDQVVPLTPELEKKYLSFECT